MLFRQNASGWKLSRIAIHWKRRLGPTHRKKTIPSIIDSYQDRSTWGFSSPSACATPFLHRGTPTAMGLGMPQSSGRQGSVREVIDLLGVPWPPCSGDEAGMIHRFYDYEEDWSELTRSTRLPNCSPVEVMRPTRTCPVPRRELVHGRVKLSETACVDRFCSSTATLG
jgi:hypothetical protein